MSRPRLSDRSLLLILFVLEFLVFRNFYHREIAWGTPANDDQCQYLFQSYRIQEAVRKVGILALPDEFLSLARQSPQGCLLPVEGAVMSFVLGGARFPRLLVNFLAYILLQAFAFDAARRFGRNRAWGYIAVGLLLCQNSPWFWAGDLFDFRIDFVAYCLYGILACAALRSELFLDRRWTLMAVLVAVILVLNRYLSLTYVGGTIGSFAVILALAWYVNRKEPGNSRELRQRLVNILLGGMIVALLAGPFFWIARSVIYQYYLVGHVLGEEKRLRLQAMGIKTAADLYLYYPRSILGDHLGGGFGFAALCAAVAAVVSRVTRRERFAEAARLRWLPFAFLGLAIAIPFMALTADMSKSQVAGNIVGPPLVLLIVTVLVRIAGQARFASTPPAGEQVHAASSIPGRRLNRPTAALALGAGIVCALGVIHFVDRGNHSRPEFAFRSDIERVVQSSRLMATAALRNHAADPGVSNDLLCPWFNSYVARCAAYEQDGNFVELKQLLGGSIYAISHDDAMAQLAASEFVILTTTRTNYFEVPINESLAHYKEDMLTWSEQNLLPIDRFYYQEHFVTLYARPTVGVGGISGGWITSSGLDLDVPAGSVAKFPIVEIAGQNGATRVLPHLPVVTARADIDGVTRWFPVSARFSDTDYDLQIDCASAADAKGPFRVHLSFDAHFVPKDIGTGEDTRELVVMSPTRASMVRAAKPQRRASVTPAASPGG